MGSSPHLLRAYELARKHYTHPNPRVGAVVVSPTGEVLGEGAHLGPGSPHAEVAALDGVFDPRGATIYVSLEPCAHTGRTPPCVDRLIAAGVARVVIGTGDPDARVAGAGIATLLGAGIEVDLVDDPAARELDPGYFHHRETGSPFVTLKYAMTLDGSVAAADGTSQWITSEEARADAHVLRSEADAVIVGAGTLIADDPRLDVRLATGRGHQPRPVVVAGRRDLPDRARIWDRDPLVVSTFDRTVPSGDLLLVAGAGHPDPVGVCAALAAAGYLDLLVEGGPTLAGAWWRAGVIDRGVAYIGGRFGGGQGIQPLDGAFTTIGDAVDVTVNDVRQVGTDVRVDFEIGR